MDTPNDDGGSMDRPVRDRPDVAAFHREVTRRGESGVYVDENGKRHFGVANDFDGDVREVRWLRKHLVMDDEVLAQLPIPGHFSTRGRMLERLLKILRDKPRLNLAALLVLVFAGCSAPTDPRIEDPCYAATVHVDSVTFKVDSVSYEWTPGDV